MSANMSGVCTAEQNPHMAHGLGIEGLCHNLQVYPPEWAGAIFTGAYDPQRLEAIACQARNIKQQALEGVKTAGVMLALGMQSGELEEGAAMNAGWLVQFLGEIASLMDVMEANAQHDRDHGSFIKADAGL